MTNLARAWVIECPTKPLRHFARSGNFGHGLVFSPSLCLPNANLLDSGLFRMLIYQLLVVSIVEIVLHRGLRF